ncbi:MAG TPA: K+/H+ antiporter subunit F [Aggregatilineales bacterium]|nr:K+/H+ antiporter subunit F [Aggregatilineales bacterium]
MTDTLLAWALGVSQVCLAIAIACAGARTVIGPRAQDRVLGVDTLYTNTLLLMLTFGIRHGTTVYFEAALIIALCGFVATAAFAKFLMRGEVIE